MAVRPYGYKPFFSKKRPEGASPVSAASVLGEDLRIPGLDAKLREYKLRKGWRSVVGDGIAKNSSPLRLIGSSLHISVSSSTWMTELTYRKDEIRDRVNAFFSREGGGAGAVEEIVFKCSPPVYFRDADDGVPSLKAAEEAAPLDDDRRAFIEKTLEGLKVEDPALKEIMRRAMERSGRR